jgi:hypothetical protein
MPVDLHVGHHHSYPLSVNIIMCHFAMRVQRCGLAQALVLTAYAAEVVTAFLHSLPNKDAMQLPICRGVPFRIMSRQHRTRDAVQNNTGLYSC